MKSHLISQVILKQFANSAKEVLVHDLKTGYTHMSSTNTVAFEEVDRAIIGELEAEWCTEIESKAEKAIHTLENGSLLYSSEQMGVIKRLMALHYMRTQAYIAMQKPEIGKAHRQWVKDEVLKQYPDKHDLVESELAQKWPTKETEAVALSMKEYIPKIEAFLESKGLEVGVASDGSELILGDVPAITADGNGSLGALNGVPITEAVSFAMPLTPKYLVALKSHPTTKKYKNLTAKQVENANNKQLLLAAKEYYSKPAPDSVHHILFFNGLSTGEVRKREQIAINYLRKRGVQVTAAQINWYGSESFASIFKRMVKLTQQELKKHGKLTLVGSSAGGSMAVNILSRLRDKNLSAVTLCSRLQLADLPWWDLRSLERMAHMGTSRPSQAFLDSVTYCSNKAIPNLTTSSKQHLIIVQQWADFVVPRPTMSIDGVQIYKVPALGHGWGIAMGVRRLPRII